MPLNYADGVAARVDLGSGSDIDSPNLPVLTCMIWFYPTVVATSPTQVLWGKNTTSFVDGFHCTINQASISGNIQIQRKGASDTRFQAVTGTVIQDQWNFVAGVYHAIDTNPGGAIYKGSLTAAATEPSYAVQNSAVTSFNNDSAVPLYIGNTNANTALEFRGDIAAFAIIDRDLTLAEVVDWQFRPRVIPGTLGYYRLGANGTGTQPDWSGNGRGGTVTGATLSSRGGPLGPWFGYDVGLQTGAAVAPPATPFDMLPMMGVG